MTIKATPMQNSPSQHLPPLLRRSCLLPGESLPSLLERLTHLNCYKNSTFIHWIYQKYTSSKDNLYRPKYYQTFLHLAELTKINEQDLFTASSHYFAPALNFPGIKQKIMSCPGDKTKLIVTQGMIATQIRTFLNSQFCPLCLNESTYHRRNWIPAAIAICLHHKCLLISQCPDCGKNISVAEIVNKCCQKCKADLGNCAAINVADDEFGVLSQQFIQSWLSGDTIPNSYPNKRLPPCPPAEGYYLLEKLRAYLLSYPRNRDNLSEIIPDLAFDHGKKVRGKMVPKNFYLIYRTVFKGLWDWPQGFFKFLDTYRISTYRIDGSPVFQNRFRSFEAWVNKTCQQPQFAFLLPHWVHYLAARDISISNTIFYQFRNVPWFIQEAGLWTQEQTARELNISKRLLSQFYLSHELRSYIWPQTYEQEPMFKRRNVLKLKRQWRKGLPISHVCELFGLQSHDVLRLIELDCFTISCGVDSRNSNDWLLDRQSVDTFFEKLNSRIVLHEGNPYDLLSLHRMKSYLSGDIDRMALLKFVIDGILPAYYRLRTPLNTLLNLYFLRSTIIALLSPPCTSNN